METAGFTLILAGAGALLLGGLALVAVAESRASSSDAGRVAEHVSATTLGTLPAQALSAEEIGKQGGNHFTGAMITLYATGNGERATAPADFDWFEYAPGS